MLAQNFSMPMPPLNTEETLSPASEMTMVIWFSHADKENLIWESFKQRIGQSEATTMLLNLPSLIQRHDGLNQLEEPFSTQEIDAVVKQLPNDKSPSPTALIMNSSRKVVLQSKKTITTSAGVSKIPASASKASTPCSLPWSQKSLIQQLWLISDPFPSLIAPWNSSQRSWLTGYRMSSSLLFTETNIASSNRELSKIV